MTDWVHCAVTAKLLADTHIGSGAGGADIDALVSRDRYERPVVWATHLVGVLRDVADRLDDTQARARFGQRGGVTQQFLVSSLHTDQDVECRIWRSSARAAFDDRAPRDDTLRVVEQVPKGTVFTGSVEIRRDQVEVLRRLLTVIDALGSGRANNARSARLTLGEPEAVTGRKVEGAGSRLLLRLRNVNPVCVSATANPDNIIPTAPYIPGRTLMGALAAWLANEGDTATATSLTSGEIKVSDALPLPTGVGDAVQLDRIEVSPAPLSLVSEKPEGPGGALPWWAQPVAPVKRVDREKLDDDDPKHKRPEPDLFVCRTGKEWSAYRPAQSVRLRNGRSLPNQDDPSLFATEYIAEDTHFLAEITGPTEQIDAICAAAEPVLSGARWLRIGRGGAPVQMERATRCDPARPDGTSGEGYVTLTSDLLIRGENLDWVIELTKESITKVPGWPKGVAVERIVQDRVDVHGFNGTARLWRRPAAGIRRGTVLEVKDVRALASAAAAGGWLGERTSEGFGRFRIDTTLPGVIPDDEDSAGGRVPATVSDDRDDPTERIAGETRGWLEQRLNLATHAGKNHDGVRFPSVAQWFALVAELRSNQQRALSSRRGRDLPVSRRPWTSAPAAEVLDLIEDSENPPEYADMFVRWLRAKKEGRS